MVAQRIHIGTSGWQYKHWRSVFYPPELRSQEWLQFYARHFDTLELNVTFYREVKANTYERWRDSVPRDFLFSAKMSRYVTHIRRLNVEPQSISRFLDGVGILSDRLGVVLIQLPPSLKYEKGLVSKFFETLDQHLRYAVEARNKTFLCEEFFDIVTSRNIAWCISESAGRYPYAERVTADFVYLRLHGREKLYASSYSEEELRGLADKIKAWGRETFAYFDNDYEGFAVRNASSLKRMLAP